jgi:hypothetical protein
VSVSENQTVESRRRHVFVSYAQADKQVAQQIADALQSAGLRVWIDEWELASGDSIAERIEQEVRSSDILLVLLSPSSLNSRWLQKEISDGLSGELRDRGITVIAAVIEDCDIPPLLADKLFDLRENRPEALPRLVEQIGSASDVDFAKLDSRAFERMAADLLRKLGYTVQESTSRSFDPGFDFVATYRSGDPSGSVHTKWFVQAKLYRESGKRVGVAALQKMIDFLTASGGTTSGLIITNSRPTSIARNFLAESTEKSDHQIRVIDGSELTILLIKHPDLIRAYFLPGQHP